MSSRTEIIETLSQHTSVDRREFTQTYEHVAGYPIEFGERAADKTADSHGEKGGKRVTFLAQDGSYPELPYFTDNSADHIIGKSLDTGLGAVNNRLKALIPENPGQAPQGERYKGAREDANIFFSHAAFVLLETAEVSDKLQGKGADALREFLAANGSVLSREQMHTASGNFIVATAANINTALKKVRNNKA